VRRSSPVFKKTTLPGRSVFKSFINNESGCGLHRATSVSRADCSIEDTCRGSIVRRVSVFSYHRRRVPAARVSRPPSRPSFPFSFPLLSSSLSRPFIRSIPFLVRFLPSFFCVPELPRVCTQSQTSVAGKPKDVGGRIDFFFFKAIGDDTLMRPGLCGWTKAPDLARDRRG